jgi:transcriptional regulator with XRE-family HTH domain
MIAIEGNLEGSLMFGQRLKELRKEKKLTAKQFGEKFNLAESTISGYETGARKPDIELVRSFANFFEVTSDYLLGISDMRNPLQDLAAHRSDNHMDDLPEEARKEVDNFIGYIRNKYGKANKKGHF